MIDINQIFMTALANTISGLVSNIAYIILFIFGVRFIGKEIRELSKSIPLWIDEFYKLRERQLRLEYAKGVKK